MPGLEVGYVTPALATFFPGEDHYDRLEFVPWGHLDSFYGAVVQSVEEAIANALVANEDMAGCNGHRTPALPRDRVAELIANARSSMPYVAQG